MSSDLVIQSHLANLKGTLRGKVWLFKL
jgi:hypothetical protein